MRTLRFRIPGSLPLPHIHSAASSCDLRHPRREKQRWGGRKPGPASPECGRRACKHTLPMKATQLEYPRRSCYRSQVDGQPGRTAHCAWGSWTRPRTVVPGRGPPILVGAPGWDPAPVQPPAVKPPLGLSPVTAEQTSRKGHS